MKPFDLEAAKRGEPIQARIDGEWNNVKFVGLGWSNAVIVDHVSVGTIRYPENRSDWLRMAPQKKTVYVNLYTAKAGESNAWHHDSESIARSRASTTGRTALAIAVPIEIEE